MIDFRGIEGALRGGGLLPEVIKAGELTRCKVEGDRGSKKSGAFRLFDDGVPTCVWWNWKTGDSGVWIAASERTGTPAQRLLQRQRIDQARREREQAQERQWERNHADLLRRWSDARPLTAGCPAGVYLQRRGLAVPHAETLRFVPELTYWHEGASLGRFPAMLGAVTSPAGRLVAIHRTYLSDDGHKADVPTAKKLTHTSGPLAGASVKIGAPVQRLSGGMSLGVAEGIETAIAAAMLGGIPVWSCVSAHGMAAFSLPNGLRSLYVFADNDANGTGQAAAAKLASRAARAGVVARVLTPPTPGDWNDELQRLKDDE